MTAEHLRVGIVGPGGIARSRHIPNLRALPGVELVSLAASSPESARQAAAELGVPRAATSWEELVADPGVDAVVVATWPALHAPVTVAALQAGKHVLTEGRMATDAGQARAMLAAARRRPDLVAMVVPAAVTFWVDGTVRRLLREQVVGRLHAVRAFWGGTAPRRQHPAWRRDRARSGNNVMELGILLEALSRWFGYPVWVQAVERLVDHRAAGAPPDFTADVPDYLALQAGLPGGVPLTLELSPHALHGEPRGVHLFGSAGTLHVNLERSRLVLTTDASGPLEVAIPDRERRTWRVEAEFAGAIRGQEPVRFTDFPTGVHGMEVTDAVRRAAATGQRQRIDARGLYPVLPAHDGDPPPGGGQTPTDAGG